jgi:pantothenate synthetase
MVDADSLLPVNPVNAGTLVAVGAYVGKTRLIDNFLVAG